MAYRVLRRAVMVALFGALIVAGFIITPTQAAVSNQAPDIISTPLLILRADETYAYTLAASDADGDALSWTLTVKPEGATLTGTSISWSPRLVGTYNVVAEVTDNQGGFDTQVWQITVTPGHPTSIIIEPNADITPITVGMNKQFTASATDAEGNAVGTASLNWSADATIGSIGTDGLFLAEHGGTGSITATLDGASQSVEIAVADTRGDQVTPATESTNTNTTAPANTNAATTNANSNTNTAANTNTNENTNQESTNTNTAETTTEAPATTEAKPCVNLVHWAIIVILLAHALIIILYYRYERTAPTPAWWILPLLTTIIALIIYYQQICPGEYLWWPWTIVGIGVLATIYYKGKRGSDLSDESQTKLPI